MIVRDFNAVVGQELIDQSKELFGKMPDAILVLVLEEGQMLWEYFIHLLSMTKSD